jgi:hypothetical protein
MLILDDSTPGASDRRWDTHPKAGWDEFTAARNRHFERLQLQSELTRIMLDAEDSQGVQFRAGDNR